MGLMEGDYPTDDAKQQFFVRVLRALRANPAFEGAAMTDRFRMTFANFGQYEVDGQTYVTDRDRPQGNSESVSDSYFSTLGLKMLEGRDFTIEDTDAKQPVAIVNASFARKYFGSQSPIGHRVRLLQSSEAAAVAHDRRRRARHADAGPIQSQTGIVLASMFRCWRARRRRNSAPSWCGRSGGQNARNTGPGPGQSDRRTGFQSADLFRGHTRAVAR